MEYLISKLSKMGKHPLLPLHENKYFDDFVVLWKALLPSLSSRKKKKSVLDKLLINTRIAFEYSTYLQGVSEIVIRGSLISKGLSAEADKKLHDDNNSDVDLSIIQDSIHINFEVKCPNAPTSRGTGLIINPGFRTVYKDVYEAQVLPVINKIGELAVSGSCGEFTSFEISKNNDMKLATFLGDCQRKFNDELDCLNVLVLSVPISRFADYFNYFNNPWSGILVPDAKERYLPPENFDKVDVIWCTTLVDKHTSNGCPYNAWDLDNVLNVLSLNPFSKYIRATNRDQNRYYLQKLLEIIPNETERFDNYICEFYDKLNSKDIEPDMYGLMIAAYLDQYHKEAYNPNS